VRDLGGVEGGDGAFGFLNIEFGIVVDESGEDIAFLHCVSFQDEHLSDDAIDEGGDVRDVGIRLNPAGRSEEELGAGGLGLALGRFTPKVTRGAQDDHGGRFHFLSGKEA
jgi:hypothetical protein